MRPLDAATVLDLARLQRQSWIDESVAQRIAAGATAAVAAVQEVLADAEPGLLSSDAADFQGVLEALAGDEE
jgi:hypothetical protein